MLACAVHLLCSGENTLRQFTMFDCRFVVEKCGAERPGNSEVSLKPIYCNSSAINCSTFFTSSFRFQTVTNVLKLVFNVFIV